MTDLRVPICCACFRTLTAGERNRNWSRCDQCEQKLVERFERWRNGRRDPELDRIAANIGQVR